MRWKDFYARGFANEDGERREERKPKLKLWLHDLVEYIKYFGEFHAMWCRAVVTSYASTSLDVTCCVKVASRKAVYLYLCHTSYKAG